MSTLPLSTVEENMVAAGISPDEPAYQDYFGFNDTELWYFPDGKQYIEFKPMTEGMRAKFQKATSRDVRLFKTSGDASIKVDPGTERRELIITSVVGWNLKRRSEITGEYNSVAYTDSVFIQWLESANPKLVDKLEFAIRKANPWMQSEMGVADIDEEIKNLNELREAAVKREEGK